MPRWRGLLHPILIQIGDFPIHTFGVCVLLAVILSLSWVRYDAPRVGIDPEDMVSLGIEVFLAGLVGSRILFVLHNWSSMGGGPGYTDLPWYAPFNLREGGLIWYGGLLAATACGYLRARAWKVPVQAACDVMAGGIMLGLATGRVGCLMAGDDHGKIAADPDAWYTITFTDPNALLGEAFKNVPLLPAQPAMMLGAFSLFLILISVRKKLAHVPSGLACLLFTLYPIHRFFVEFIRGDKIRGTFPPDMFVIGGLSTSQAISIPVVMIGASLFVWRVYKFRGASAPEPLPGWPDNVITRARAEQMKADEAAEETKGGKKGGKKDAKKGAKKDAKKDDKKDDKTA
jgi:phosphatidylglycerol:prolipoprotein diacylglycerol transferase